MRRFDDFRPHPVLLRYLIRIRGAARRALLLGRAVLVEVVELAAVARNSATVVADL